jgi:hypothetical protein
LPAALLSKHTPKVSKAKSKTKKKKERKNIFSKKKKQEEANPIQSNLFPASFSLPEIPWSSSSPSALD